MISSQFCVTNPQGSSAVEHYEALEMGSAKALTDLTAMAAEICGTSVSLITIVDDGRVQFKAMFAAEAEELAEQSAFYTHSLKQGEILMVTDARADSRFAEDSLVTGAMGLRFYAGVPLTGPENVALGTLCVMDRVPRILTESQKRLLRVVADQVTTHLELGRQVSALRISQETFSRAFENAAIGMGLVSLDGHWLKVNQAFCELLGYTAKELCTMTVGDVTHADDIEANLANARKLLEGDKSFYKMEKRYLHKNGDVVWGLLSVSVIRDKKGRCQYFVSQVEDIGELKQAMALQQELTQKAQAAEKAKSQFLATMSHEIRTPLNGVIGMASILADTQLNEMQRECVETINVSGESLLAVINDILDYSKIEAGRMELEKRAFNLQQCVEEAYDIFAIQLRSKKLEGVYLVAPEIPVNMIGDSTRLRQILVNLIGNAIKFTAKGDIAVHVECQKKDEAGYHLLFSVSDSGIGIPKEAAAKLFNAFQQVDTSTTRKFGGTGLGLAICKRLTALMGGTIWVESVPGTGSTFKFSIVLQEAPADASDNLPSVSALLESHTALIVDSHETNRRILELQLKFWGMTATGVASGTEAKALLKNRKFDTILIDSLIPDTDAVEFAKEIRKTQKTPMLLISSTCLPMDAVESSLFEHQLSKPIKHSVLFNSLLKVTGVQKQPQAKAVENKLDAKLAETNPLRILMAEDNVVNQKVGVLMLSRLGYTTNVVPNGKRALEALDKATYDVILMDIQMPEMNGIDATKIIRETYAETRPVIVALTAEALEGDEQRLLDLGFDCYLSKPIQVHKLQKVLESIVPHEAVAEVAAK